MMKKHLPVPEAKAAFVDVGSEHMHVSVGGDVRAAGQRVSRLGHS